MKKMFIGSLMTLMLLIGTGSSANATIMEYGFNFSSSGAFNKVVWTITNPGFYSFQSASLGSLSTTWNSSEASATSSTLLGPGWFSGSGKFSYTGTPQPLGLTVQFFNDSTPGQKWWIDIVVITKTPEPGTIALLGMGLLGIGLYGRRRRLKK